MQVEKSIDENNGNEMKEAIEYFILEGLTHFEHLIRNLIFNSSRRLLSEFIYAIGHR